MIQGVKRVFFAVIIMALMVSGCKNNDKGNQSEATGQTTAAGQQGTGQQGTGNGVVSEGKQLYIKDYTAVPEGDFAGGIKRIFSDMEDGLFYVLYVSQSDDTAAASMLMNIVDMENGEMEQIPFAIDIPGAKLTNIGSMRVGEGGEISFILWYYRDGEEGRLIVADTDRYGNILDTRNPTSEEEQDPYGIGRMYGKRKVYDCRVGKVLCEWDEESQGTTFSWVDGEGEYRTFGRLDGARVGSLYMEDENTAYYISDNKLIKWNIKKDTREKILSLMESGMSSTTAELYISRAGDIMVCVTGNGRAGVYALTDDEDVKTTQDAIRLVRLKTYGMEYVSERVADFSGRNPDSRINIEMETQKDFQESYHDRIFIDMVNGKGPDMLWVSKDDMRILNEKGLLLDLSKLIPEDIMENILPSVIADGTFDGKFVGIAPEISFTTVVTSDALWTSDDWTLSDFINIIDSRDYWEWPIDYNNLKMNWSMMYYAFFIHSVLDAAKIDFVNGTCDFYTPEYRGIVDICKKYGVTNQGNVTKSIEERQQMLYEGDIAASVITFYGGLPEFSRYIDGYKGSTHIVGYPGVYGGMNFLFGEGYLVVNARSKRLEEIGKFIELLLDYNNQHEVRFTSVRSDVLRGQVRLREDWESGEMKYMMRVNSPTNTDKERWSPLVLKENGETYLEEYMAFVESCVPYPYCPEAVSRIIGSELYGCFDEGKDVDTALYNMQNRVMLYLDEQK